MSLALIWYYVMGIFCFGWYTSSVIPGIAQLVEGPYVRTTAQALCQTYLPRLFSYIKYISRLMKVHIRAHASWALIKLLINALLNDIACIR